MVMTATGVACVGAVAAAVPLVSSLAPSQDVLAVGATEVDLGKLKSGESMTVMWRGQPVFILHRTEKQIEESQNVNLNDLKDPQSDADRVKKGKEQWLVTIGVCTHLGCVPLANKGEFDGWLCPCHGSHYDASGRVRKGPAPLNLPVPPYEFLSDIKIKIG
ncbi:MAG: ubiquinol-cytochrome c reductase iron-sulfur subunit [Candidatus Jidaibacter sp.]|nr:ubiquinol-cytochrome c reductase iron-sulfur subunit [Candidatus Jidaibacter sp.]